MSGFENTTVMGFTGPLGSAQGVSPIKLKNGMLSYSSSLMLNKDGTVYIDCGTDYNADDDAEVCFRQVKNTAKGGEKFSSKSAPSEIGLRQQRRVI